MHRRRFIAGLAASGLGLSVARAQPEAAPAPLTLFVPTLANSGLSALGQAIGLCLGENRVATTLTHDPRSGAAGLVPFVSDFAGRDDALILGGYSMIGAAILARLPVNLNNLSPVARLTTEYMVCAVRPDSPIQSLTDLVTRLHHEPASVELCGADLGTADHLLAAMIARRAGIGADRMSYRPFAGGGDAIVAVLQGHEACVVGGLGELQAQLALGQLRALAISAPQRLPGISAPTFLEQGMAIELSNWRGVFAPPGVAARELDRLIALTSLMVSGGAWKATLFRYNWTGDYLAGPAFDSFVQSEIARVRAMLAELGL